MHQLPDILERDECHKRQQQDHARRVDVAFILGGNFLLRDRGEHRVHQQQKRAAAVQRRQGQHVHDGQIDRDERPEIQHVQNAVRRGRGGLAGLGDGGHHADRPGHVVHRYQPGHQIPEAHPDEPRKIQRRVPRVFEDGPDRLLLVAEIQAVFILLHAVHVVELLLHGKVLQLDQLPVPLHDQIVAARLVAGKERGDVGIDIHAAAVDLVKLVADLQPLLRLQLAAVKEAGDLRGRKARHARVEDRQHHQARQKVHERTGRQNDEPFPPDFGGKGPGIVGFLILALHGAVAAHGNAAQGIERLAALLFHDGRAHADGKLVHLHVQRLGREKMAQLVDEDQKAENQDRNENIHEITCQKTARAYRRGQGGPPQKYRPATAQP